ncbi:MAG: TonB-dependent receptor [Cyclobacteriaceae bacterium]|nr:TonB-dependent receptor [Cyclobacteriaceae bacterium]
MKKILLILFLAGLSSFAMAQKVNITGQVLDTLSNPIPSATVMLLNATDSSLVNFGVSDVRGVFELKNVAKNNYFLKITFVGLAPFLKPISTLSSTSVLDVGRIKMEPYSKELEGIVIMGEKAPVTVKRDTIEFNAGSFKTKANATVEDLLKKLPGMEVATDGTVKAQGEDVQRVMVDGREFFGRDPKLATRNLPADAIEKVQVFDKKSDQSAFTGIEDGSREKTINLELKEEKRNGAFGKIMAGAGTDDRFRASASINRFGKGQQLSFLGMGNNVNEQGFSIDDFMNFSGGSQALAGGGGGFNLQIGGGGGGGGGGAQLNTGRQNGIMTNYAGGVNFNRDLDKDTKLTSSYFYNRLDQNITKNTHRINYLPNDSSYFYDENSIQRTASDSHRGTLNIDHSIDSANSIKSTNTVSYSQSEMNSNTLGRTTLTDNSLQNESQRYNYNEQTSFNLNSSLLYRHKFAKKGRSFSNTLAFGLTQTNSNGNLQSTNQYFNTNPGTQEIVQTNTQSTQNQSIGTTLSYIEPLGGRKYLEATYAIRTNLNQVNREVFDEKNGQATLNTQLTNKYNSTYLYSRPGLNIRVNRQKYNFSVGASYQNTHLQGDLISKGAKIDRSFENILPVVHFNYDFSTVKHLRIDYETSMQEPSIQQLQPVIDNTDPLNISTGNPELRPGYQHRVVTNFTTFDPGKFINLFALFTASYTTNPIISSQSVNANLVRVTKPINVSDNLNLTGNFNFGMPVKKLLSRFNIGPNASYTRGINSLNDQLSYTWQQSLGGRAGYNFTYKEFFTLDLSANLSHQETTYEFNKANNQTYFNKTYTAETNVTIKKNYQFNTSFDYLVYTSQTTDYNQTIPYWNMSISRFMLKNNVGELKFSVNNILDQSLSVAQSATTNYLQQQVTNNLGRYFMVSFTYALNKQLNPMGAGRPGGGQRMIFRP